MLEYRAEGLCRNASHLRREELDHCIAAGEVLQSTALAFDTNRRLRFELCGHHAYMPFEECLDTAPGETVKEIAVLTRVGRPTCFVVRVRRRMKTARQFICFPARRRSGPAGSSTWTSWKTAA